MYPRYLVTVYIKSDDLIYKRRFKSLNNAIKVLSGFDKDCYKEIEDIVMDKTIYNAEINNYIQEICSYESEEF